MNFHYFWCYGSGVTTGLLWRWFYSPEKSLFVNLVVFSLMSLIWPLLACLLLIDIYRERPLPWED